MRRIAKAIGGCIVGVLAAALGASACTTAPAFILGECDPDPFTVISECIDAGSDVDVGTLDASDDGAGGGSNARNACPGRCVYDSSDTNAGLWSDSIVSLWVGPKGDAPKCCPGDTTCEGNNGTGGGGGMPSASDVPTMKFRRFDKIIAPPAECDPCECGASDGTCAGLPDSIEIRAGTCAQSGVSSLPFNGPPGWDGSCSNQGALAAGALCNGVPCAQSVWASPLPGPTNEACAPISATPKTTLKPVDWETAAIACTGTTDKSLCKNPAKICLNDPGLPWLFCVYREEKDGEHEPCPANFNKARYELYPEEPKDDRGCEACSCGAPVGSGCLGKVPLYKDGVCQVEFTSVPVSSMGPGCVNVQPPGIALGSNEVTGLGYMPGVCSASGGAPKGNAAANPDKRTTFCCASLFDDDGLEEPK